MKNFFVVIFIFIFSSSIAQKQILLYDSLPDFYINHVATANETFLRLASLYNVSPSKIASYNALSLSQNFTPGQVIKIPVTNKNLEQKGEKGNYEVLVPLFYATSREMQLREISTKFYNVSIDLLKSWNASNRSEVFAETNIIVGYLRVKKELSAYFKTEEKTNSNPPINSKKSSKTEALSSTEFKIKPPSLNHDSLASFDPDSLFALARNFAFEKKNYSMAIYYSKIALIKSPRYSDIRTFLGRVYTWTNKSDSAREAFNYVTKNDSSYEDAYIAFADLEYNNNNNIAALDLVNKGLQYHSQSKDLLLKKVKILNTLKRSKEAAQAMSDLIKADPKNAAATALSFKMRQTVLGNVLGINYDYTYFDKQFTNAWHITSIDYSRQTNIGSFGARISYANRFRSSGVQYELETYPNISKNLYSYVDFAYSNNVGIFPNYRGGFSLYANLPKSFEGELGFRYLNFGSSTWIYTTSLGKYYKSWFFNARTYLTPSSAKISQSYSIDSRYYYGGTYDYIGLVIGTGISPDERPSAVLLNSSYKLLSKKISATYKHEIKSKHIITFNASWINNEYLPKTKGNQFEGGISYQIRL